MNQQNIKDFFVWALPNVWDVIMVKNLILWYDFSDFLEHSKDIQAAEFSYEYNFLREEKIDDFRIAIFGVKKDFFLQLQKHFPEFQYEKLYDFFSQAQTFYKEDFLTVSLTFDAGKKLEEIKVYFDTFVTPENPLFWAYFPESFVKIIENKISFWLASLTLGKTQIRDIKLYIPTNQYILKCVELFLKNNQEYQDVRHCIPFDVLFRFWKDKKLESIKLYYQLKKFPELKKKFGEKYFPEVDLRENMQDEIWIDFDIKKGINKLNYYIWLFR